nr:hypothetical protein [Tanacetum cinerariifolium]
MSLINQCLTGKTSGNDKPRHLVLQMLWGIMTRTNVHYAQLLWEEFVQGIQTFFTHWDSNKIPSKKPTPQSAKPTSLQKVGKGKVTKVRNVKSSLQLVDEHDKEQAHPEPEPQGVGEEYDVKQATQMSLESFQSQGQAHVGGVAIREPVAEATRPLPVVEGKGKAIETDEQVAQSLLELHTPKKTRTTDQYIFQRWILMTEETSTGPSAQPEDDASANIICDTPGEQGEDVANREDLEGMTAEIDEGQARSDPCKTLESRPPPEYVRMEEDQARPNLGLSHVALAEPDLEPMHDDFVATMYPQVHECLKHPNEEHIHVENPLSSTRILSSMKNLDAYTYGDQFFNDKPTGEDLRKTNMETEVKSMDTVPIHQASSLVTPLSTPVIDLTHPKPIPSTTLAPIFTATTTTETITTALPTPLEQQSSLVLDLASRVSTLEQQFTPHSEQLVEDVPLPDDVNILNSEDTDTAHIPKIKTRLDWLKHANALAGSYRDPDEYKLLRQTGDMSSFINRFCKRIGKMKLSKADLEGPAIKVVRPFHDNIISLQFHMEECHLLLTVQVDLVNPKGCRVVLYVTIQSQFFFNKDLEYLVSGMKERRSVVSISKLKAANYPDFRLKELIPSLRIESKREYDISAAHVRSHMRILSVVSLKTYERYGYTFLKEIVLRRADYNEYKISEADFKNLYPKDFEDLYLLHLQGHLNHLSGAEKVHLFNAVNLWIRNIVVRKRVEDLQLRIESYQTKLNLTQPDWDASDFLFKEDYTIVRKLRTVIYRDRNYQKKMMQETEVHKFSDGTLNRILDKLDHMVKDFKLFKYNPGMETRIWSEDDRRRSKEFMEVIENIQESRKLCWWKVKRC